MENKYYRDFVIPLIFGFIFLGMFLFYSVQENWNYSGFNGMNLFALLIGIIALIFSGLSYFEIKGKKWASFVKMILIGLIALFIIILIVYSYIIDF